MKTIEKRDDAGNLVTTEIPPGIYNQDEMAIPPLIREPSNAHNEDQWSDPRIFLGMDDLTAAFGGVARYGFSYNAPIGDNMQGNPLLDFFQLTDEEELLQNPQSQ